MAAGPVCSVTVVLAAEDWADWAAWQAAELEAEETAWPWQQLEWLAAVQRLKQLEPK